MLKSLTAFVFLLTMLGLAPSRATSAPEDVTMRARPSATTVAGEGVSWAKALETSVLARSEELAELPQAAKMAGRFAQWGYPLPDGKIALDSSIRLSSPIRAEIDVTNILDPGKPKTVFSLRTDSGEYRVYEMTIPLAHQKEESCPRI
jgi:hypothetical protein